MNAQDIRRHFETTGARVAFVFEDSLLVRAELAGADLGQEVEVVEYKGDAFAVKFRIHSLPPGKRLLVVAYGASPFATGGDPGSFPLLGELMANGECVAETPVAFMSRRGMNTGDAALLGVVTRHLAELSTAKAEAVFAGKSGEAWTAELAARGLASIHLGANELLDWDEIFARLFAADAEVVRNPSKKTKAGFLAESCNADLLAETNRQMDWRFGAVGRMPSGAEIGVRGYFSDAAERIVYNAAVRPLPPVPGDPYAALRETDVGRLDRIDAFLRRATEKNERQRKAIFESLAVLSGRVKADSIVAAHGACAAYGLLAGRLPEAVLRAVAEGPLSADSEAKAAAARRVSASPVACDDTKSAARAIAAMARFYARRASIGTFRLGAPADIVAAYAGSWWELDREYRLALEHLCAVKDDSRRAILEKARATFENDAHTAFNEMNLAWTEQLAAAGGMAATGEAVPQEAFARSKIDPSVKVAVVVSDALRYEVALEVMDRLNAERGAVEIEPGLARLPTETKYTKAALLPHDSLQFEQGAELRLDGGRPTVTTADKENLLRAHFADGLCTTAKELKQKNQAEKREIFKHRLVYVFHRAFDDEGHSGATGQEIAREMREAIEELVSLIRNIQNSNNVSHLWLVSDHGFLLADHDVPEVEKIQVDEAAEAPVEKTTRYYFTRSAEPIHGIVKLPLGGGVFVAMPRGTLRFKAQGGYTFVHGGCSLQEMVIPVMHSRLLDSNASHRREKVGVAILGAGLKVQSSRIRFELLQKEAVSADRQERTVRCALFDGETQASPDVLVKLDSKNAAVGDRTHTVELTLSGTASGILTLKVFGEEDGLNPLDLKTVVNNTLIGQDEW